MRKLTTSNYPVSGSRSCGYLFKGLLLFLATVLFQFTDVHAQVSANEAGQANDVIKNTPAVYIGDGELDPNYLKNGDLSWMAKSDIEYDTLGNPDLPANIDCTNLRVVLVLDESGSIKNRNGDDEVREATMALAEAFQDSPAQLTIIEFDSKARIVHLGGPVVNAAFISNLHDYLYTSYNSQSYDPSIAGVNLPCPIGFTNWEDAFITLIPTDPNLVLFLTDGEPSVYNVDASENSCGYVGGNSSYFESSLAAAIPQANIAKSNGAHIFAIGVGDYIYEENLKWISGNDAFADNGDIFTDDYSIGSFLDLKDDLTAALNAVCGTEISITKTVDRDQVCSADPTVTFTLTVKNTGGNNDYDAVEVTVLDTFPSAFTNLAIVGTPIVGTADIDGQNLVYNVGNLASDESATIQVQATLAGPNAIYLNKAYGNAVNANKVSANATVKMTDITSHTYVVASCGPYTLDGNEYTAPGIYPLSGTSANGCPYQDTLDLTINEPTFTSETVVACGSYTWGVNGETYDELGTHTYTYVTPAEGGQCAATATLNLTIEEAPAITEEYSSCTAPFSPVDEDGVEIGTYFMSTIITTPIPGENGCDGTHTLIINIVPEGGVCHLTATTFGVMNEDCECVPNDDCSETSEFNATACDSYIWEGTGQTLTVSDDYQHTFTNINGCDSLVTLHLTINHSTSSTDVQTSCGPFTWIDGNVYTESNNTATVTIDNSVGCDSVITLDLTIGSVLTRTDVIKACDSYTWIDGNVYTADNNTATYTKENEAGCDSLITLDLTINHSTSSTDVQTSCGPFTWIDGEIYTESNNTATYLTTNAAGCDSLITLNLTIGSCCSADAGSVTFSDGSTEKTICVEDGIPSTFTFDFPIHWNTDNFTRGIGTDASGNIVYYTDNESQAEAYDFDQLGAGTWYIHVVNFDPNLSNGSAIDAIILGGGAANINDFTGCFDVSDPIIINGDTAPASGEENAVACGSYSWNGETFTESGDYTRVISRPGGLCDSTATLHLVIGGAGCAGDECENFQTYYINHGAGIVGSDIYSVDFTGTDAILNFKFNIAHQAHMAIDAQAGIAYFAYEDGSALEAYDLVANAPIGTLPLAPGLSHVVNAVYNPADGLVYIGDMDLNKVFTIDPNGLGDRVFYANAPISGGDLAFQDGALYLATKASNQLYKVVQNGLATLVGSIPDKVNGIAAASNGSDLIVSNLGSAQMSQISSANGAVLNTFDIKLNGESFTLKNGDLASGCADSNEPGGDCTNFKLYYIATGTPGVPNGTVLEGVISGSTIQFTPLFESGLPGHMALNTNSGDIYVINNNGQNIKTFDSAGNLISDVAISGLSSTYAMAYDPADGKLFVGSAGAHKVYKLDPATGDYILFANNMPVSGGDIVVNGDQIYLISRHSSASKLYNITSGVAVLVANIAPEVNGASLTANGGLIVARGKGSTSFYTYNEDGTNEQELAAIDQNGNPFVVKDGDMAGGCVDQQNIEECENFLYYYTASNSPGVAQGNVYKGEIVGGDFVLTYVFNPGIHAHIALNTVNGNIYAINTSGNSLKTFDASGNLLNQVNPGLSSTVALVWNPANGMLYVGSNNHKVYELDPVTGSSTLFANDMPVHGGDLVINNAGELFLVERVGSSHSRLYNITSGTAVWIADVNPGVNGAALTSTDGFIMSEGLGSTFFHTYDGDGNILSTLNAVDEDGNPFTVVDGDMASGCMGSNPVIENGDCNATEVVEYVKGIKKNSSELDFNRTDDSKALGAPERSDALNFVTLGYGGHIILAFDGAVPNGPGDDIEVVETTYNFSSVAAYPEYADVFVSLDGATWDYIGTVDHENRFVDISNSTGASYTYVNYVKIVNNDDLSTTEDAYDLDGVVALHNCVTSRPSAIEADDVISGEITSNPNPTSGNSTVIFSTAKTGMATVEVYDMNGRKIATVFNQEANEGQQYRLDFNGNDLPNGVYIYRMTTNTETIISKFMIAK